MQNQMHMSSMVEELFAVMKSKFESWWKNSQMLWNYHLLLGAWEQ